MHSPLMMQLLAHLRAVSGPVASRTMSRTPAMTSCGSASLIPAAPVIGQALKQAPHLVQASSMSSTRAASATSNAASLIGSTRSASRKLLRPLLEILLLYLGQPLQEGHHRPDFRIGHSGRAEARHAGHVDAIFYNPEQMARLAMRHDL